MPLRSVLRAVCLAGILTALVVPALLAPASAAAASPSPGVVAGGDTRSEGEGAGLVGSPFLVALAVVGVGLAAAGLTIVYVKLAGDRR